MLTLYALGGLAAYLTIGAFCARKDINDSIDRGLGNTKAVKSLRFALLCWPAWLWTDGVRILSVPRIRKVRKAYKLQKKIEEEEQKALKAAEGEIQKCLKG